jgi:hypothetical protein
MMSKHAHPFVELILVLQNRKYKNPSQFSFSCASGRSWWVRLVRTPGPMPRLRPPRGRWPSLDQGPTGTMLQVSINSIFYHGELENKDDVFISGSRPDNGDIYKSTTSIHRYAIQINIKAFSIHYPKK